QATSAPETTREARNERVETEFFRRAVIRMLHAYDACEARSCPWLCELDLPDSKPAVSAVAFQHARPTRKTGRERFAQICDIVIQPDVAAPAKGARSVEDLLRSERAHDIGVRTHPNAGIGNLPQKSIQQRSVATLRDRVHPHEHAVDA